MLRQDRGSPEHGRRRFNPFFIRAMLPTDIILVSYYICIPVSIPSSSGQCFQRSAADWLIEHMLASEFQSLLHQCNASNTMSTARRSIESGATIGFQSLLHQGNASNEKETHMELRTYHEFQS